LTDFLFPPHVRISAEQLTAVANTNAARSIFTGAVRTTSRAGSRLRFGLSTSNASVREDYRNDAALQAFFSRLEGQTHRLLFADPGYALRGSFPTGELLSNNTFANGTTGWSSFADEVLSVSDRVMRVTRRSSGVTPQIRQRATVIQYAPYASRAFLVNGRGSPSLFSYMDSGAVVPLAQTAGPGMATASMVASTTTIDSAPYDAAATGNAGDYFEVHYMSLARCALIDGGVNLLTRSEEFNDATWAKGQATVTANSIVAPDGTLTADDLVDNAVNALHFVQKSFTITSSAVDIQVSIAVKARSRSFCTLLLGDGSTNLAQSFNLAIGALGASNSTGATWANLRSFVTDLGNGWYRLTMVGRKTSSATAITMSILPASSDGGTTYAGSSNAAIALWRATGSLSGVPARLKQTSSVESTGETQNGTTLHLKGLPPSMSNLLLPGARVQLGTQLNIVTAPLHSDAAGFGFLECGMRWRVSPSDNAPVIIHQPFGRFIQTGPETGWDQQPGGFSNYDLQIEEALDA
jgi:hypothetical protein